MALSGTLETFSLRDVLQLLASTDKTGVLSLTGDRGRGQIWVRSGDVVQATTEMAGAEGIEGALFDMLRFTRGSFAFDAGESPEVAETPVTVTGALEAAESLLAEWREIETVVPSLSVAVHLAPEVDVAVSVKPAHWRVLARVGSGETAQNIADSLGMLELEMCRMLRDMVEAGMVEVSELPESGFPPATPTPVPAFETPDFASSMIGSDSWTPPEPLSPSAVADDETRDAYVWDTDPADEPEVEADVEPTVEPTVEGPEAVDAAPADEPVDDASADEFLSQLANLSPKAAAAIEATEVTEATEVDQEGAGESDASLDEDALTEDPSLDGIEDSAEETPSESDAPASSGDDNLLLKFLSSTKS